MCVNVKENDTYMETYLTPTSSAPAKYFIFCIASINFSASGFKSVLLSSKFGKHRL